MSGGLAQKASHAMAQGAAWKGHEEIPSCIMGGGNGDKNIDGRCASDHQDDTPVMANGARIMNYLDRSPTGATVAMVGTVQEEDCDGLCRQYDKALQINAVHARYPSLAACKGHAPEKPTFACGRTLPPILEKKTKAMEEHIRQDAHATLSPDVRLHRGKSIHSRTVADLADKPDATGIASGVENLRSCNVHNIFHAFPSTPPGSASSLVASAGERSHASSIILARLGIPSANNAGRARIDKRSPLHIPEHCRPAPQAGFLPFFWRALQEQNTPAPQPRFIRRGQQRLLGLRRSAILWHAPSQALESAVGRQNIHIRRRSAVDCSRPRHTGDEKNNLMQQPDDGIPVARCGDVSLLRACL